MPSREQKMALTKAATVSSGAKLAECITLRVAVGVNPSGFGANWTSAAAAFSFSGD
jgi:hypothetical protein